MPIGQKNAGGVEYRIVLMAGSESLNHPGPMIVGGPAAAVQMVHDQADVAAGGQKFAVRQVNIFGESSGDHVSGPERGEFNGFVELDLDEEGGWPGQRGGFRRGGC